MDVLNDFVVIVRGPIRQAVFSVFHGFPAVVVDKPYYRMDLIAVKSGFFVAVNRQSPPILESRALLSWNSFFLRRLSVNLGVHCEGVTSFSSDKFEEYEFRSTFLSLPCCADCLTSVSATFCGVLRHSWSGNSWEVIIYCRWPSLLYLLAIFLQESYYISVFQLLYPTYD